MAEAIPEGSHLLVRTRARYKCERCGAGPGQGLDWHHRRSRRVKDKYTHDPSNGVLLCRTCHRWAHGATKFEARRLGFMVSQWEGNPGTIPIRTASGWALLTELGTYEPTKENGAQEDE